MSSIDVLKAKEILEEYEIDISRIDLITYCTMKYFIEKQNYSCINNKSSLSISCEDCIFNRSLTSICYHNHIEMEMDKVLKDLDQFKKYKDVVDKIFWAMGVFVKEETKKWQV